MLILKKDKNTNGKHYLLFRSFTTKPNFFSLSINNEPKSTQKFTRHAAKVD